MQRVIFLSIGRMKTSWIAEGCKQFTSRLARIIAFTAIEIPASRNFDPQKQVQEESAAILEKLERLKGDVWLLDVCGEEMSSETFAKAVEAAKDAGRTMIFILGGAYGVSDAVRERANAVLRLSPMTFPHEFCCLVFLEQLYRATEIQRGTGYHH
ncbi:23S rRNA (pseudouridine(1915)-N(3))-methyltransferase RlmH [Candidatus Peregrinibacteria bacterium]|nr:23S rRNA (pseudouridine(1915)-N(3))-methyltransferase RlmH [Candidatus Peregrinibacteria bacterium]MBI3816061.1 23S rRNA (pseudouridine(1915)-N(3))-methyltransferase RlmH [Candidatus Peregrinibacteria bacterium]